MSVPTPLLSSLASHPHRRTCHKRTYARTFRPTIDETPTLSARSALTRPQPDPQLPSNTSQHAYRRKAGLCHRYSSNNRFLSSNCSPRNLSRKHRVKYTIDVIRLLLNPQRQVALLHLPRMPGSRRMERLGQLVSNPWRANRRQRLPNEKE